MPSPRTIAGFFVRLFLVYGLLVVPWPELKAGYASLYRAVATAVFGSLIPGGAVRFEPMLDPYSKYDTDLHFLNTRSGARQRAAISTRDPAYFQTIFLVSLVLATPLPWRRRWWALVSGLTLVHGVIFCTVLVMLLYGFTRPQLALLAPGPPWGSLLSVAHRLAAGDTVGLLCVPVFIWILVAFRGAD